mgnify:CR=1 FL=1
MVPISYGSSDCNVILEKVFLLKKRKDAAIDISNCLTRSNYFSVHMCALCSELPSDFRVCEQDNCYGG